MELPPLTPKEATKLLAGPFGEQLHRIASSQMTSLLFGDVGPNGEALRLRNGTCFFVKTSNRTFAVTARHVLEGFQMQKGANPTTRCQIGNLMIDPIQRAIAVGTKLDIATFHVTDAEIAGIGKSPISLWPPHPPDEDDRGVLLAGYPAKASTVEADSCCFGIYAAIGVAQRVTEWQLTCNVEWDNIQSPPIGSLPPRHFDTGGMSGGPVLSVREKRGFLTFPLAGVISEGRAATDTIIAERADGILANGDIRY